MQFPAKISAFSELGALRINLIQNGIAPAVEGAIEVDAIDWLLKWKLEQVDQGETDGLDSAAYLADMKMRQSPVKEETSVKAEAAMEPSVKQYMPATPESISRFPFGSSTDSPLQRFKIESSSVK